MLHKENTPTDNASVAETRSPLNYDAFVSYASEDREKAQEICDYLESCGSRCWIAPRDVRAGREYPNEIIHGIEHSRCLVLVLSEAANQSLFVRREVERAVSKRKPVFPIRIEDVLPSPSLELLVSATHWIDAWSGVLARHVERLAKDLASIGDSDYARSRVPESLWSRILKFGQRNIQSLVALSAITVLVIVLLLGRSGLAPHKYRSPSLKTLGDITTRDLRLTSTPEDAGDKLVWTIRLDANWTVLAALQNTTLSYSVDRGPFMPADSVTTFNIDSGKPFKTIALKFTDSNGKTAGPFEFSLNSISQIGSLARQRAASLSQWIACKLSQTPFAYCSVTFPASVRSSAKELRYGFSASALPFSYALDQGPTPYAAGSYGTYDFVVPRVGDSFFVRLMFNDPSEDGVTQEIYLRKKRAGFESGPLSTMAFPIASKNRDAYAVYASLSQSLDRWLIAPFPNDPTVQDVLWSPDNGPMFSAQHQPGYFSFTADSKQLGLALPTIDAKPKQTNLVIRYNLKGNAPRTFTYGVNLWAITIAYLRDTLRFPDAIECRHGVDGDVFPVICTIPSSDVIRALFIDEIWWGTDQDHLQDADSYNAQDIIRRWQADQSRAINPRGPQESFQTHMERIKKEVLLSSEASSAELRMRVLETQLTQVGGVFMGGHNIVLGMPETSSVLFKVTYRDGNESGMMRVQVK